MTNEEYNHNVRDDRKTSPYNENEDDMMSIVQIKLRARQWYATNTSNFKLSSLVGSFDDDLMLSGGTRGIDHG